MYEWIGHETVTALGRMNYDLYKLYGERTTGGNTQCMETEYLQVSIPRLFTCTGV